MYRCYDCLYEFEVPIVTTEQRAGEPSYDVETCPYCGSDDILDITDLLSEDDDE
jgi:rRNA maturation endonuclease Nob1